ARLLRSPVALSRRPIPAIVSRGSKIVLLFAAIDLLFRAMSGACYLPAACPAQGFSDGQSQSPPLDRIGRKVRAPHQDRAPRFTAGRVGRGGAFGCSARARRRDR